MAKTKAVSKMPKTEEATFWMKLVDLYNNNKTLLNVLFFIVLAGGLLFAFMRNRQQNNEKEAAHLYDSAVSQIPYIYMIEDETEMIEYYSQLVAQIEKVVNDYPSTIASVRARLFLGKVHYESFQSGQETTLDLTISYFQDALDAADSKFYQALATLALAQTYEQSATVNNVNADFTTATTYYQLILDDYSGMGFDATALIGLGRLRELFGDIEESRVYYGKVIDNYPDSLWARYARGKIYSYELQEQEVFLPEDMSGTSLFDLTE